jgi:hypothetical protein
MGFTQRFNTMPSIEVLSEIESIVTIDQSPPASSAGVSTGVVCCVGEFADVTFGVAIDANGVVTTFPQPVEIFSGQDEIDKLGGFDETIGEFGGDHGNGFVEFAGKPWSRRVAVPINLASSQGARMWRKLPTNTSATDPTPVVPVIGATVPAGREFKSGNNRVRCAKRVQFASTSEFSTGVNGATTATSPAATQTFSAASAGFTQVTRPDGTVGVRAGDALVVGVIGGAGALGANADTYRIVSTTSDTVLVVQKQDGTNFDWTTGTNQPFRIHASDVADTGGEVALSSATGYRIPMRPLDATIAASTSVPPTVVPPALTATSADPLSGLTLRTDPTTGLVYTAAVQAPNAASSSALDALYVAAIEALIDDDLPEREVNFVWSARSSDTIDSKIVSHVLLQKINGIGRVGLYSPPLDTVSLNTAIGDTTNGVGARRARESQFCWPGVRVFIREAVGLNVKGADGVFTKDGNLDVPSASWKASIFSFLAPERSGGQASEPVKTCMANAFAIQRGVTGLGIGEYKRMRARGISGPRLDRRTGMVFQSDVTRSLTAGEKEMNTRRFSFFVQDSIADILVPFTKEILTDKMRDEIHGLVDNFFGTLLSQESQLFQRIRAYRIDATTGNTIELVRAGIFVLGTECDMLALANTIVHQSTVGPGLLNISQAAG